ncbi:unnamed protein product [Colias eurytheme]|nr:unnamed protein product [Colias eurytheme]
MVQTKNKALKHVRGRARRRRLAASSGNIWAAGPFVEGEKHPRLASLSHSFLFNNSEYIALRKNDAFINDIGYTILAARDGSVFLAPNRLRVVALSEPDVFIPCA